MIVVGIIDFAGVIVLFILFLFGGIFGINSIIDWVLRHSIWFKSALLLGCVFYPFFSPRKGGLAKKIIFKISVTVIGVVITCLFYAVTIGCFLDAKSTDTGNFGFIKSALEMLLDGFLLLLPSSFIQMLYFGTLGGDELPVGLAFVFGIAGIGVNILLLSILGYPPFAFLSLLKK